MILIQTELEQEGLAVFLSFLKPRGFGLPVKYERLPAWDRYFFLSSPVTRALQRKPNPPCAAGLAWTQL